MTTEINFIPDEKILKKINRLLKKGHSFYYAIGYIVKKNNKYPTHVGDVKKVVDTDLYFKYKQYLINQGVI